MKVKLTFDIECGEKTCAMEPGKFCRFLGSRMCGTISVCMLFPSNEKNGSGTDLKDQDGWVQRCPACLTSGTP